MRSGHHQVNISSSTGLSRGDRRERRRAGAGGAGEKGLQTPGLAPAVPLALSLPFPPYRSKCVLSCRQGVFRCPHAVTRFSSRGNLKRQAETPAGYFVFFGTRPSNSSSCVGGGWLVVVGGGTGVSGPTVHIPRSCGRRHVVQRSAVASTAVYKYAHETRCRSGGGHQKKKRGRRVEVPASSCTMKGRR